VDLLAIEIFLHGGIRSGADQLRFADGLFPLLPAAIAVASVEEPMWHCKKCRFGRRAAKLRQPEQDQGQRRRCRLRSLKAVGIRVDAGMRWVKKCAPSPAFSVTRQIRD